MFVIHFKYSILNNEHCFILELLNGSTRCQELPMSVENEPIIPVQVKYIEVQSATVRRNEKIPLSSRRKTQEPLQQSCEATLRQNGVCHTPVAAENIDISCVSPVTSPGAGSPTNPLVPNKFQFDPNLTYAEKVAHEMIVTEKIYLDNLKQIIDVSNYLHCYSQYGRYKDRFHKRLKFHIRNLAWIRP